MRPDLVEQEKKWLKEFLDKESREPTSRELVIRAKSLGLSEVDELEHLMQDMFSASSTLVLSSQPIMADLKKECMSALRRYRHLISREYTKEEFENLPKNAQGDMERALRDRHAYLHALIDRHGKH
ncbi:hypothetical protein C0431_12760 [bacterium]|nr:hypothetical protein [bacterium]